MAGIEKTIQMIEKSVQEGNYYEAHQMYHSVSQRLFKQKKIQQSLLLLTQGAQTLIKNNQLGSANDLVSRIIDIYESEQLKSDSDRGRKITIDSF
jgi:hypothetical protein